MSKALDAAERKGRKAAMDGLPMTACPYEDKRKESGRTGVSQRMARRLSCRLDRAREAIKPSLLKAVPLCCLKLVNKDYEAAMAQQPNSIEFTAEGVKCIAFRLGSLYGLNMRTCVVNYQTRPDIQLEYLPSGTRVLINNGDMWFDTDGDSAAAIEELFQRD